jgi:methyl-accepting chemotaxis protein
MFNERRTDTRDRAQRKAVVRFGRAAPDECIVRDVSESGARLQVADPAAVPARFEIRIANGAWRNAQVRWRTRTEVGVEFM